MEEEGLQDGIRGAPPASSSSEGSKEGWEQRARRLRVRETVGSCACLPLPIDRIEFEKWISLSSSKSKRQGARATSNLNVANRKKPRGWEKAFSSPISNAWPQLIENLLLEFLSPLDEKAGLSTKGTEHSVENGRGLPANGFFVLRDSSLDQMQETIDRGSSPESKSKARLGRIAQIRHVPSVELSDADANLKVQGVRIGKQFLHANPFARLRGDLREPSIALPPGQTDVEEGTNIKSDASAESRRLGKEDSATSRKSQAEAPQEKAQQLRLKGFKLPVVTEIEKLRPRVEELRSSLPSSSLADIVEKVRHWGQSHGDFPNKQKLSSVQEFFRYTEAEGRKLFDELDADGDGQVRLEDLEVAMRKRRLPSRYAREFLRRTRRNWFVSSFGWEEFQTLMEQKEATMLRAFNSLNLSASGTLQKSQVLASLKKAGLPATEGNARAMMQYLDADTERGQVAYGQFRNFLLLLPPERLDRDPSMVWFEAATVVPMAPPASASAPAGNVLKSALAGGLASGLSTCIMHPLDTLKTRVQASPVSFGDVMQSLPKLGLEGLYRGSVPAIIGQFASHGLRTGAFEATKMLLQGLAPDLTDIQVQPIASLCSTVLGTGLRIPCEVLKQRLQAGMYPNAAAAIRGTLRQEGPMGMFRGTAATLCREVPFYVAGLLIYQEAKKVVRHALKRDLAPWETLLVGGISGGLAAVCTTPFDVIKTRMMTAAPGHPSGLVSTGAAIIAGEGVLALYKGALPRFFWIAPLGAMNFAGYELAKQAMEAEKTTGNGSGSKILMPARS